MDLAGTLKRRFGYDQFRPLQREIISDSLAGRDLLLKNAQMILKNVFVMIESEETPTVPFKKDIGYLIGYNKRDRYSI